MLVFYVFLMFFLCFFYVVLSFVCFCAFWVVSVHTFDILCVLVCLESQPDTNRHKPTLARHSPRHKPTQTDAGPTFVFREIKVSTESEYQTYILYKQTWVFNKFVIVYVLLCFFNIFFMLVYVLYVFVYIVLCCFECFVCV